MNKVFKISFSEDAPHLEVLPPSEDRGIFDSQSEAADAFEQSIAELLLDPSIDMDEVKSRQFQGRVVNASPGFLFCGVLPGTFAISDDEFDDLDRIMGSSFHRLLHNRHVRSVYTDFGWYAIVDVVQCFDAIDPLRLFYGSKTVNYPFRLQDRGEAELFCIESGRTVSDKMVSLRMGDGEFKFVHDTLKCKGLHFTEVWQEQSDRSRFRPGPRLS